MPPMLAAASRVRNALYFMVKPEQHAAQAANALMTVLQSRYGLQGNAVTPDRQHVTLHSLGEYDELPEDLVAQALRAGAAVELEPFDVEFDRALGWGSAAKLLALGSGGWRARGMKGLQGAVAEAMVDVGLGRFVRSSFQPHVSLLYGDKPVPVEHIEPIGWTVSELLLVHSAVGLHEHRVLGRWPLVRRQQTLGW